MPRPSLRTRSRKRKRLSLPGGRTKVSYREGKTSSPRCSRCGRRLTFLPRSMAKTRKLPKTQKRVSRPFGGQLCHLCLRSLLKQTVRNS